MVEHSSDGQERLLRAAFLAGAIADALALGPMLVPQLGQPTPVAFHQMFGHRSSVHPMTACHNGVNFAPPEIGFGKW